MIAAIVSAGLDWAIGQGGNLLVRIPPDLKRFRKITVGGTVIMGRRTYDSLSIKPLPNRESIVISRRFSPFFRIADHVIGSDLEHAKQYLADHRDGKIFIIGGGQIYAELLDYCDTIFLTRIFETFPDADALFPDVEALGWTVSDAGPVCEHDGHRYQFLTFSRR